MDSVLEDPKHKHLIFFYRSDCQFTPKTKANVAHLLASLPSGVKVHEVYDGEIHVWKKALQIPAHELKGVPAILLYYRGKRRWFLARNAPLSVQQAHLKQLLSAVSSRSLERSAGNDARKNNSKPVFLTYHFNRAMRHDPVHIATVGGLMLLSKTKGTPVAYRPVPGIQMHGVLVAHGNPDRTYKGHAAADYVALLLEAHERLTPRKMPSSAGQRAGGADNGSGANWADYLTGFTVVAALLA